MTKRLLKFLGWTLLVGFVVLLIWLLVTMGRENDSQQQSNNDGLISEATQESTPEVTPESTPEATQEESAEETQQEAAKEVAFDADSVIRIIPADEAGKVCVYFGDGSNKIYGETDSAWIVVDEATNKTFLIDDESFKMVEEESRKAFEDGRLHITFADGQKRSVSY